MSTTKRPQSSTSPDKDDLSKRQKKSQSTLDQFKTSNQSNEQPKMDQNEQFQMLMNRTEKLLGEWENFQVKIDQQFKEIHEKQNAMNVTSKLSYERSYQNEQYQRNYNIRIYGVSDEKDESIVKCEEKLLKIFKEKLKIEVKSEDIDIAHRIGTYSEEQDDDETPPNPRTVICRFVHKKTKKLVLQNRRKLKKRETDTSCIVIKEDLTKYHQQLLAKCIDRYETAWARDGRIFVKENDNSSSKEIKSMADLGDSWAMSDSYVPTRQNRNQKRGHRGGRGGRGGRGAGRGVWRGGSSPPVGRNLPSHSSSAGLLSDASVNQEMETSQDEEN